MTKLVTEHRTTRERSSAHQWSLDYYRRTFGWPVRPEGGSVLLSCSGDMAAVAIPTSWAGEVTHRLVLSENLGPLIAFAQPTPYWVLLAEWEDLLWAPRTTPPGVRLLHCQQTVPLPVTFGDSRGGQWVVPPDARKRVRPRASAIYAAIAAIPLTTQIAAVRIQRRAA